jgi:hypothetical protein
MTPTGGGHPPVREKGEGRERRGGLGHAGSWAARGQREKEEGRRPWAKLPGGKGDKEKGEEDGPAREGKGREKERRFCKFTCF